MLICNERLQLYDMPCALYVLTLLQLAEILRFFIDDKHCIPHAM